MFLTAFLGNALRPPFAGILLFSYSFHEQAVQLTPFCAKSLSGTVEALGLKTTTVSAYLNFTVQNPTCVFKQNYFKENYLQGWKYHPVSVAVLVPTPCPMGRCSAVCQLFSGLGVGFQLCPSPCSACLVFSPLLKIYSRNRKHETHLNS